MSLDISGGDDAVKPASVSISVTGTHPLIQLANVIPWIVFMNIAAEDLKRTTKKGFWWMGPRLFVRVHLAAFILQKLYNLTDRQTEYSLKDNAAYQLFAGKGLIIGWRSPDHTKIEEFRSRLSPETQRILANETARLAVNLGFADPRETDIDSTVQEANIAYPADVNLMTKLTALGHKVISFLRQKTRGFLPSGIGIDMKTVKSKARSYFFLPQNCDIGKRRNLFNELHRLVKQQFRPVVAICNSMDQKRLQNLPWNIRLAVNQIKTQAWRYLLDVGHFTRTHAIKMGKTLAFHAQEVTCIRKGKVGKENEFGRVFQLGRIKGNFLYVLESTSLRMEDKHSLIAMVSEHARLFGNGTLHSVAADKGYWSAKNYCILEELGIGEIGLQRPANVKKFQNQSLSAEEHLHNRRAGIEPLIGHVKHGGQLGKSRMRSDTATLAAGYASVLGFNLRQLSKKMVGPIRKDAA
jgi:IS5 family transposase